MSSEGEGATKTAHRLPAVEFAQRTDPGRDPHKQINEDTCRYGVTRLGHLAVTCDGMGGHEGGREASSIAVDTIFEVVDAASPEARAPDVLRDAIARANAKVCGLVEPGHEASRPGSTIVAVLLHARGAEIAHVGDSRVYMTHQSEVIQLTHDHSMVQQMVDAGLLTQAEEAKHPNANQISRALGMKDDVDIEVRQTPIAFVAGDAFILCSDGLSDLVSAREILEIVGSAPAAQAVGQLVDLANARGGHDNITVQVLRVRESSIGAVASPGAVAPTVADAGGTVGKTITDAEGPRSGSHTQLSEGERSTHVPSQQSPQPLPRASLVPRRHVATTVGPEEGHRRWPMMIVGIVLAVAGLAVAGGVLWVASHRSKRVPVFEDLQDAGSLAAPHIEESRPEPPEAVPLAPLIAVDSGHPPRRRHHEPSLNPTSIPAIPTEREIEW